MQKNTFFIPYLLLLGIAALAAQCQAQTHPTTIRGTLERADDWKPVVYLIQPRQLNEVAASFNGIVADSAVLDEKGVFVFKNFPDLPNPVLYQLVVQPRGSKFRNQLLDHNPLEANYLPVIVQNGSSISLSAAIKRFQATANLLQPDAQNLSILHLRNIRHQAFAAHQTHLSEADHPDETLILEKAHALLRYQQPLMQFADTCTFLLPALTAVRWVSPESDYERTPEFLVNTCRKWSAQQPHHPWTAQLCTLGNRDKLPVLTGDLIPNFALPTAAGDTVMLHQMLGKKITVLDLWASWCAPCRKENRTVLVPLWKEYQGKGLQIIGYALDSNPGGWKAAIAKDGAEWPHTSHLSGDSSPFLDTLRITTIPANFILDAEGRVIAKNLHGAELEAFIRQQF